MLECILNSYHQKSTLFVFFGSFCFVSLSCCILRNNEAYTNIRWKPNAGIRIPFGQPHFFDTTSGALVIQAYEHERTQGKMPPKRNENNFLRRDSLAFNFFTACFYWLLNSNGVGGCVRLEDISPLWIGNNTFWTNVAYFLSVHLEISDGLGLRSRGNRQINLPSHASFCERASYLRLCLCENIFSNRMNFASFYE